MVGIKRNMVVGTKRNKQRQLTGAPTLPNKLHVHSCPNTSHIRPFYVQVSHILFTCHLAMVEQVKVGNGNLRQLYLHKCVRIK